MWDAILSAFGMGGGQAAAGATGAALTGNVGADVLNSMATEGLMQTGLEQGVQQVGTGVMNQGAIDASNKFATDAILNGQGQGILNTAANQAAQNPSIMQNISNLFKNEGLANGFSMGKDIMNYSDSRKDAKHLKGINNQNMAMTQCAYDANMADRAKTSNLNF